MGEEQGFQVRDRRSSTEGEQSPSEPSGRASEKREPKETTERFEGTPPPITFTSFILSLATSGLMQLGQETESGTKSVNLVMARQTIDLLALLQEKTQGNRTAEEEAALSQVLYTLRMMFVEVEKKH